MQAQPNWVKALGRDELRAAGARVVKPGGRQVLLLDTPEGIFAISNRCPHEGYPLSEGTLSCGVLTCNWHNWKFDLKTGRALDGGDPVRTWPVEERGGEIWVDISDPPAEARQARALENFSAAFDDYEYDRLARELARLRKAGGRFEDALRRAVARNYDRLEYGMTHAFAALPDWLALADAHAADESDQLGAALEIAAHLSWDTLRQPRFPFADDILPYEEPGLLAAIEAEDEARAAALLRGALKEGLAYADLRPALACAALAHYADFGHSAIYVCKAGQLIERLGREVTEPVLLALVRQLIYAYREERLPEFRAYARALQAWQGRGEAPVTAEMFAGRGVNDCLALTLRSDGRADELYHALFGAAAWNLLHFDDEYDRRTDLPVSSNANWLEFTHALTFANAVRALCTEVPSLWPAALLQMALFAGRNARYVDADLDVAAWRVPDPAIFFERTGALLFDHGEFRHIFAAHYVKLFTALKEEIAAAPAAPWVPIALAALNRFLNSPMRGRHVRRTARQAASFVALEG